MPFGNYGMMNVNNSAPDEKSVKLLMEAHGVCWLKMMMERKEKKCNSIS